MRGDTRSLDYSSYIPPHTILILIPVMAFVLLKSSYVSVVFWGAIVPKSNGDYALLLGHRFFYEECNLIRFKHQKHYSNP